ncbi:membrane protein [Sulfolobus monocaudavirus SMV1]|uniref:membrane protein n=1 Tax=Sulfolobus monocaudavirus SMV1 TaxID=1351702 RepID=UPI0003D81679|nr:membrane protein [Sulfolobus monocaudavirus SMV1]CDF81353.1 conserved archaeal viral membrane protein, putative transporter [Sulfolobus monocaudavirus SMV1]
MEAKLKDNIAWFLAGLGLVSIGSAFLGDGKPYLLPTAFLVVALGMLSIFVRRRILIVSAFAIATITAVANIITGLPVLTDEESIILYASQLFLDGKNPYLYSMAKAFSIYHVPYNVVTGTTASSFLPFVYIYPPLSFISVAVFHNLETVNIITAVLAFTYSFLKRHENVFIASFFLFPALSYDFATGQELNLFAYSIAFLALLNERFRYLLLGISADVKQFAILIAILLIKFERQKLRKITEFTLPLLLSSIPFISKQYLASVITITQPVAEQGVSFSLLTAFGLPIPSFMYTVLEVSLFALILLYNNRKELAWGLPALIWIFSFRDLGYFTFYFALQYAEWMVQDAKV